MRHFIISVVSILLVSTLLAIGAIGNLHANEVLFERAEDRLTSTNQLLGETYTQITTVQVETVPARNKVTFVHSLKKDICYRLIATTKTANVPLTLGVSFRSGMEAKQKKHGLTQYITLCPQNTRNVRFEIRAGNREEIVAYSFFAKGNQEDTSIRGNEKIALEALKTRIAQEPGKKMPIGSPFSGILEEHGKSVHHLLLDKSACYLFMASGTIDALDLSLSVRVHNKEVVSDRISGTAPKARWCSPGPVPVEIEISTYGSSGAYALAVVKELSSENPKVYTTGGQENDFIANRIRQLHTMGGGTIPPRSIAFRANGEKNDEKLFPVQLKSGRCYTVIASGSPTVKKLKLSLQNAQGKAMKYITDKFMPILTTNPCIKTSGTYNIKVTVTAGKGQFGVQLFEKPN